MTDFSRFFVTKSILYSSPWCPPWCPPGVRNLKNKQTNMTHHRKNSRTELTLIITFSIYVKGCTVSKNGAIQKLLNLQSLQNLICFNFKVAITKQNLDPSILASQKPKVSKWNLEQIFSQNRISARSKIGLRSLYLELSNDISDITHFYI